MLFNNLAEVQYVRGQMDQKLRSLVEAAGYVNFGFAGGGFAQIMSKQPIANPRRSQMRKTFPTRTASGSNRFTLGLLLVQGLKGRSRRVR